MIQRMGAREARNNFADLLGRVGYGGEMVILERSGRALAALVPIEIFERLMAERDARFSVFDRIRAHMPDVPDAEIEQDVEEAVRAVRRARASDRA